jgi:Nucleotide-diphospho-sugar transferase
MIRYRPRYAVNFMIIFAIACFAWNDMRQLLPSVEFLISYSRPGAEGGTSVVTEEQRVLEVRLSTEYEEEILDDININDSVIHPTPIQQLNTPEWPPLDVLEALISESPYSYSTASPPPNHPRLVVAVSNLEDVELADNFANHLLALNVTNFVLVPLDEPAHQQLQQLYPNHTLPILPGLESYNGSAVALGSAEHDILVAYRPIVIQAFLQQGYAVFYNDVDTVWQRNAWTEIDERTIHPPDLMLWNDGPSHICDCILYVQPTDPSMAFMTEWKSKLQSQASDNDQAALTKASRRVRLIFESGKRDIITIIPNDIQFPSSQDFSWNRSVPENEMAVVIHNSNEMRNKMAQRNRFEAMGLWNPSYRQVTPNNAMSDVASDFANWPPENMIDAMLLRATIPSTTRTKDGIPRVVVVASNFEFIDFADNFANSLLALNVTNFVIVPLDEKAYTSLHLAYPEHTLPTIPGLQSLPAGKADFGSKEFKLLTASRPIFLRQLLRKGYAALYNDVDMVWQHNAWDVVDQRDVDPDDKKPLDTMLWKDSKYQICTCLMYLKPTFETFQLLDAWEAEINTDNWGHDQDAFDQVAKTRKLPRFGGTRNRTKVCVNDIQFPSGKDFSWNHTTPSNDEAIIVHNNWIRGKNNKQDRFITAGIWKPSGRLQTSTSTIIRDNE